MTKPPEPAPPDEERFERVLGGLLRVGVVLAAAIVLFGGTVYLIRNGNDRPDFTELRDEPSPLQSPRGIIRHALEFRGRYIVQFGLLVLIATPVARVLFSVVGFARERDWTYVILTLFVLGVLLYSLFLEGP
jgi:uncharacterized membrane protein